MINHKAEPFVLLILFIFGGIAKKTKDNNIVMEKGTLCDLFTTFKWTISTSLSVKKWYIHCSREKRWLHTSFHHFFPRAVELSFLHTRGCGNAIPIIIMVFKSSKYPFPLKWRRFLWKIRRGNKWIFLHKKCLQFKENEYLYNWAIHKWPTPYPMQLPYLW